MQAALDAGLPQVQHPGHPYYFMAKGAGLHHRAAELSLPPCSHPDRPGLVVTAGLGTTAPPRGRMPRAPDRRGQAPDQELESSGRSATASRLPSGSLSQAPR
jgi:hypothetical protein